jgi:hypothetical protein
VSKGPHTFLYLSDAQILRNTEAATAQPPAQTVTTNLVEAPISVAVVEEPTPEVIVTATEETTPEAAEVAKSAEEIRPPTPARRRSAADKKVDNKITS